MRKDILNHPFGKAASSVKIGLGLRRFISLEIE